MKHARFALCVLMGLGPVSTVASQDPASAPSELLGLLARAEAKWQASMTEAYEFRFQYACNGLIPPPAARRAAGRVNSGQRREKYIPATGRCSCPRGRGARSVLDG